MIKLGKKNPYVFTIGFDSKNPNHVKVAKLLNDMRRGKAQFIVDSIMRQTQDIPTSVSAGLDMAAIERLIKESVAMEVDRAVKEGMVLQQVKESETIDLSETAKVEVAQATLLNVKNSLNAFRCKK